MSYQLSEVREGVNGGRQRTQLVVADDEDPQEWELEHRWGQTGQKVATVKMSKHRSASLGVTSDPDVCGRFTETTPQGILQNVDKLRLRALWLPVEVGLQWKFGFFRG